MEKRILGRSPLQFAPVVLGGNVFGWTVDKGNGFKVLDAFIDAGFSAVDTADSYTRWVPGNSGGESETMIGDWMAQGSGRRERVLIFTKVGSQLSPDKKGLSRRRIVEAVEDSLKRLKTDRIDLYQSHRDDMATPMLETLGAYADLIKQGKVRAIGASNFSAARLKEALETARAHNLPRYESLQPEYNLYDRAGYEAELEALCLNETIGVIPYYSLANGFLTGKYRGAADFTKSPRGSRIGDYMNERGKRILAGLDAIAAAHKVKPAAVALAWLIGRASVTAPIASVTSLGQLEDFIAAAKLNFSAGEREMLDKASAA